MTRWNKISREEAKRLGIEGWWELQQMEKKELSSLNEKILEQEEGEDGTSRE